MYPKTFEAQQKNLQIWSWLLCLRMETLLAGPLGEAQMFGFQR